MTEDRIIEAVTEWFDSNPKFHEVYSLQDVESVFREVESFCAQHDWHLESDLASEDFEDLPISEDPEEERTEIKFEIPILDVDLVLEFFYFKESDNLYRINLDVDYYFPEDDESYE